MSDYQRTLYDHLGVAPGVDVLELRAAFRRRARDLHPDLHPENGEDAERAMAELNAAWRVLSDPDERQAYDRSLLPPTVVTRDAKTAMRSPRRRPAPGVRKEAWIASVRVQVVRLTRQAGRSAIQTMLVRHNGSSRTVYESTLEPILAFLAEDTGPRIRAARGAGAAPLDLGLVTALIGLGLYADRFHPTRRTQEAMRAAELVDRMWDTIAHELPREIVMQIGDKPRAARRLAGR